MIRYPRQRRTIATRIRGKRFRQEHFDDRQMRNGVTMYLNDKGITDHDKQCDVIRTYVFLEGYEIPKKRFILNACKIIQQDFPRFTEWFKKAMCQKCV